MHMPHYYWKGLDLQGSTKKGLIHVKNPKVLAEELLQNNIALLEYSLKKPSYTFFSLEFNHKKSISSQDIIDFFEYSAILLKSGIPLQKTLILVKAQTTNPLFGNIIDAIYQKVEQGTPLSKTMEDYNPPFLPFMIQLINTGENTATLVNSFSQLALYLKNQEKFNKIIKQAALLPVLTLSLALIIMGLIFIFVIPQFATFFASMDKKLPPLTQYILTISSFLTKYGLYLFLGIITGSLLITYYLHKKAILPHIKNAIISFVPFIRNMVYHINLIRTLQQISLLLKTGLPIKNSLELVAIKTPHLYLKNYLQNTIKKIILGQKLSEALFLTPNNTHQEIITTFTYLGEQTGNLAEMLENASNILEEKLQKKLTLFLTFFQPILLIIVGCIIAIIMAAIYLPLFNMSYVVGY